MNKAEKYKHSQLGKLSEGIKKAYLAHIPIVYIVTDELDVVNDFIREEQIIVRRYQNEQENTQRNVTNTGVTINGGNITEKQNTFFYIPIIENAKGELEIAQETVSMYILFDTGKDAERDAKKKDMENGLRLFIRAYNNLAPGINNQTYKYIKHSLALVVCPTTPVIPGDLVQYTKVVELKPMESVEIEGRIKSAVKEQSGIILDCENKYDHRAFMQMMIQNMKGLSHTRIDQTLERVNVELGGIYPLQAADENHKKELLRIVRDEKSKLITTTNILKLIVNKNVKNVSGMEQLSVWLMSMKEIMNDPERAMSEACLNAPKGVLISGVPGTGKSQMAKLTATELGLPLIQMDMGSIMNKYVGESEHNMENAFHLVEAMSPCVLWIDEIEKGMSGSGSNSNSDVMRRMFGKFLVWMQEKEEKGVCCFVFATSNDISQLPPELFRSGRFDGKYYSFMPSANECCAIFSSIVNGQQIKFAEVHKGENRQLFASEILRKDFFMNFIDRDEVIKKEYTIDNSKDFQPMNKFMTGADIEAIIEKTKQKLYKGSMSLECIYTLDSFEAKMIEAIKEIKTYGETNLKDIGKCFISLKKNNFFPVSDNVIVPFDDLDLFDMEKENPFSLSAERVEDLKTRYDRQLYICVGHTINVLAKERRKKGEDL